MEEVFVRYIHFLGIITLASALVGEHLLISKKMDLKSFKKLIIVDAIYGVGAIATLIGGALLWFAVGKPAEFYSSNFIFHIKLTAFVAIGLLSIFPTVYFLRNRKSTSDFITLPNYIVKIIRVELSLLVLLPLFGALIARGVGNV
ncbi:DUF2214 family protein [Marinomonas gallaica]|uniref:DUF2214 family protein n=1 Tax=Marinomonas gallaica TaxID=1806667 RepID=UPI003A9419B2